VRYSWVGNNGQRPKTLRYSVDSKGNLVSTEIDSPAESIGLCFKDIQKLELVRDNLATCSTTIASSLEIAGGCLEFCRNLEGDQGLRDASCSKLKLYIRRMSMYARTVELVLKRSESTTRVVSIADDIPLSRSHAH
jgi:hypothetical protein